MIRAHRRHRQTTYHSITALCNSRHCTVKMVLLVTACTPCTVNTSIKLQNVDVQYMQITTANINEWFPTQLHTQDATF